LHTPSAVSHAPRYFPTAQTVVVHAAHALVASTVKVDAGQVDVHVEEALAPTVAE